MNRPLFLERRTILRERIAVTLEDGADAEALAVHRVAITEACRFLDAGPLVREREEDGWRRYRYRSLVASGGLSLVAVRRERDDSDDDVRDDVIVRWTRSGRTTRVSFLDQEDMLWGLDGPRGRRTSTGLLLAAALRDVTTALSGVGVVSMDDARQASVAARMQSHRYHTRGKQAPCPYAAMGPVFRPDYRSVATAVGADADGVTIRRVAVEAMPAPDDVVGLMRAAAGEQAVRAAVAAARASC